MTYSEELWSTILQMRKDGFNTIEIAKKTGKSVSCIRNKLSKEKILSNIHRVNILAINNLTKCEKAYIAGIIDGEGSINIHKIDKTSKIYNNREKSINYSLKLSITNTDERLLSYISNLIHTNIFNYHPINKKHRKYYSINIAVNMTIALLNAVYPYLVIKKEQVDIANRFYKTFQIKFWHKLGVPADILKEREFCYLEMKRLHGKVL